MERNGQFVQLGFGEEYFQTRVNDWQQSLDGGMPLGYQVGKLVEETGEVQAAYDALDWTEPTMRLLGREATDVIIASLGIIGQLQLNFVDLFDEAMAAAEAKYDPTSFGELRASGLNRVDAMQLMKARSNGA